MNNVSQRLARPPIVETWLVVDFEGEKSFSRQQFLSFAKESFPSACDVRIFGERSVNIEVKGDVRTEHITENAAAGLSFVLADDHGKRVVVFKRDRIEVRVLGAYSNWQGFLDAVLPCAEECGKAVGIGKFLRIAIKSVNLLDLPDEAKSFSEVLQTIPQDASPELSGACAEFLYRDTQYYPKYRSFATVARTYQRAPSGSAKKAPIVLDIEVFKTFHGGKESLVLSRETLDDLHSLKNEIFFGSLAEVQLKRYA